MLGEEKTVKVSGSPKVFDFKYAMIFFFFLNYVRLHLANDKCTQGAGKKIFE